MPLYGIISSSVELLQQSPYVNVIVKECSNILTHGLLNYHFIIKTINI